MPQKISQEKKKEVWRLYQQGYRTGKIVESTGISKVSVVALTKGRELGCSSQIEYLEYLLSGRINPETGMPFESAYEYQKYLVHNAGFESIENYKADLAEKRRKRKSNQESSRLVRSLLEMLGISQASLSRRLGVSKQAVSTYCSGTYIPSKDILHKIKRLSRKKK